MTIPGASRKYPGLFYDKGGGVFNVLHPDYSMLGALDDSVAIRAAQTDANAARGTLFFPPKNYSGSTTITPAFRARVSGYGAVYNYSGTGTAAQIAADRIVWEGLALVKSGSAGTSIGMAIGTPSL